MKDVNALCGYVAEILNVKGGGRYNNQCVLEECYSTFLVRVPPNIVSLQLCTPKVVGAQFKLYIVYNLHLK
jgi:hypothetical protein